MAAPLLLLHLLLPSLFLVAAADAFPATCSNATCGGYDIHYPFRLDSVSDCGYPGLVLTCENNNTLILPVKSHRYKVLSIDYARHTVSVSDADAGDGDGDYPICPRLHVNLTIDYASSWLQPAPADSNITFLYNCKKNISFAVELIGCQQGDGGKRSYVLPDGVVTGAEAYDYECEEVVVAPVLGVHKARMVPGIPAPANGSIGVGELVRAGFELMYNNNHSQQCGRCERSGGWCGYRHNQTGGGGGMKFTCFCDNGPAADRCGHGKRKRTKLCKEPL